MSLKSGIRLAEQHIAERQGRLRIALDGVTDSVGTRMVSPPALVTAGLFGAALHQNQQLHGLRMLALLETANAGLRLLLTLSARKPATPAAER